MICNIGATLVQAIQTLVEYKQIRSRAKDMKKEQDREKERVTEGQCGWGRQNQGLAGGLAFTEASH